MNSCRGEEERSGREKGGKGRVLKQDLHCTRNAMGGGAVAGGLSKAKGGWTRGAQRLSCRQKGLAWHLSTLGRAIPRARYEMNGQLELHVPGD